VDLAEVASKGLAVARGYLAAGVHEEGGNNRGDQVEFFLSIVGRPAGDPWCAAFVSTCWVKGWAELLGLPADRASLRSYVPRFSKEVLRISASCEELARAAKDAGMLLPRDATAAPGDAALFDFAHQGVPHHVGIVTGVYRGSIATIEGNTSRGGGGSQADGGGVFARRRPVEAVFGLIRL
jgi:hypothetical protein